MTKAGGGITRLMRTMQARGKMTARECEAGGWLPAMTRLRDDYGAVWQGGGGDWRLSYAPEWLRQDDLRAALGCAAAVTDEAESTNRAARDCAAPFFLFSEHQPGGVGRRRRQWLALPGDALMMSAVLPAPANAAGLSVAVGAMIWRALCGDGRLRLKWPNDLLDAGGKKAGGILTEIVGGRVIVGVGINRAMTPVLAARIKALGREAAGISAILSPPPSRRDCAITVARAVRRAVARFADAGFAAFAKTAAAAHIVARGEAMAMADGGRAAFAGFDGDGALLARRGGRVIRHIGGSAF